MKGTGLREALAQGRALLSPVDSPVKDQLADPIPEGFMACPSRLLVLVANSPTYLLARTTPDR